MYELLSEWKKKHIVMDELWLTEARENSDTRLPTNAYENVLILPIPCTQRRRAVQIIRKRVHFDDGYRR